MISWIRYFAYADESPAGLIALSYLKVLCRIAQVRLAPIVPLFSGTGSTASRWTPYGALAATPMIGKYANVVCAPVENWTWSQTVVTPATESRPSETHQGVVELYTEGVRNVLIAPGLPPSDRFSDAAKTVFKYQAVVVPASLWGPWIDSGLVNVYDVHPMSEADVRPETLKPLIMG